MSNGKKGRRKNSPPRISFTLSLCPEESMFIDEIVSKAVERYPRVTISKLVEIAIREYIPEGGIKEMPILGVCGERVKRHVTLPPDVFSHLRKAAIASRVARRDLVIFALQRLAENLDVLDKYLKEENENEEAEAVRDRGT